MWSTDWVTTQPARANVIKAQHLQLYANHGPVHMYSNEIRYLLTFALIYKMFWKISLFSAAFWWTILLFRHCTKSLWIYITLKIKPAVYLDNKNGPTTRLLCMQRVHAHDWRLNSIYVWIESKTFWQYIYISNKLRHYL